MPISYINAEEVLPKELLDQVRQYVSGTALYIPGETERQPWGSRSGAREALARRNGAIREAYQSGVSVKELCDAYYLSSDSIRKIIRSCKT